MGKCHVDMLPYSEKQLESPQCLPVRTSKTKAEKFSKNFKL